MGIQWLREMTALLEEAGIPAGEGFPGGKWTEITRPVAAVELKDVDHRKGIAEFRVRILSPGVLGGWQCQHIATEAARALEKNACKCRMEPMEYRSYADCFEMSVLAQRFVMWEPMEGIGVAVKIGENRVSHVTAFSARQDRQRRLIGTLNIAQPLGVTPPKGGWVIQMTQRLPAGAASPAEPEEPFVLTLEEGAMTTVFRGCCWNRLEKKADLTGVELEWEGFALEREETAHGENEV